jgi:parvulin-like peptidyl-prolyl isomerase
MISPSHQSTARLLLIPCAILSILLPAHLPGQDSAPVAALVDGKPILVSQLRREFQSATGKLKLSTEARTRVQQELLQKVIQRRLALAYLQRTGQAASQQDIVLAREKLELRLGLEQQSLEQYLQERELTEQQLELQLAWQLSWPRYQKKYLTDKNLQRYFKQHQEEFDGTRRHVAHILLKAGKKEEFEQLHARQESLRQQITRGDLTFAEAARTHSESPTAEKGGDIGWIDWNGPMPRAFTSAAFNTAPGKVSKPVESLFGVHLVQCLEIKKGTRSWQDARDPLRIAIVRYLFSWAADQQREHSEIKQTSLWPERSLQQE